MSVETAVAALLADHSDGVAATALRVRAAVLGDRPQLLFPTADDVQPVFERGAALPDPDGLLTGSGKQVRMLVFGPADDVDDDVVGRYLDLAVELGAALHSR